MTRFRINAAEIRDAPTFHAVFQRELGFFDGYGRNMDAWIDCMGDLHGPNALSSLDLAEGEPVDLVITGTDDFSKRCPDILRSLIECTAAVNRRYENCSSPVRISLIFE